MVISAAELNWFSRRGFRFVSSGSDFSAVIHRSLLEKKIKANELLKTALEELAGEQRGHRNTVVDSGSGGQIFIKQYHHGGLLAGVEDVYYKSPRRFLQELRATRIVYDKLNVVPRPLGVIYRRTGTGWEGYYLSEYVESKQLSACLRSGTVELAEEAGNLLVSLHEAAVDPLDFHVDNLLVAADDKLLAVDFDPVKFNKPGLIRRAFRLNRFVRSLKKNGIRGLNPDRFRAGYLANFNRPRLLRLIDGLQRFFWGIKNLISDLIYRFKFSADRPGEVEKILVRAPNWLGDAVMSLPLLQDLNDIYPAAPVDVVCRSTVAAVYSHSPAVRQVHGLEDKTYRLPREIKNEYYSHLIVIPKSFRTGCQAFFSKIPRRIGFATQGRNLLLTDPVKLKGRDRSIHHSQLFYHAAGGLCELPEKLPQPEFEDLTEPVDFAAPDIVGADYITIHPGTAYGPAKRWPVEKFRELLELIVDELDYKIVALGVQDERSLAAEILSAVPEKMTFNLAGETTLEQCMGLLNNSCLTVANDSGIMHLSAGLKTPTVGLFGSTSPELTSPEAEKTRVIYSDAWCSPCFKKKCLLKTDRYQCLKKIMPRQVFGSVRELLAEEED